MNKVLLDNRPQDSSPEEFKKAWDNSGYVLEALWKTLGAFIEQNNEVKKDDFDCPNHYAKLAYQAGLNKAWKQVMDMLPESAKP
jgi:hypothetical protein